MFTEVFPRFCAAAAVVLIISAAGAAAPDAPPPKVSAGKCASVSEATPRRYVGSVLAIEEVEITPRVTGTLLKTHFTEGAMVNAGDLLYELEDTTYRAAVDSLLAQKELQEAALRYADSEFKRNSKLLQSRTVSESTYDKALLDIDSARANLKNIDAALTDARNTLSYTRIHAPISGRIGVSLYSDGNLLTPQTGKLTDIVSIAPIYVKFSISEKIFSREFGGSENIRDRAVVRVQTADGKDLDETAEITIIDNRINPATNTITIWATFPNRELRLTPGGFVTVYLAARHSRPLPAVPPSALVAGETGYSIYVIAPDNTVSAREVKPGGMHADWQIIDSGLDGSETIVVDGTHKVRPGMTVEPVFETAAE